MAESMEFSHSGMIHGALELGRLVISMRATEKTYDWVITRGNRFKELHQAAKDELWDELSAGGAATLQRR
ncbi:hypothetical protein RB195_015746 [Necator americanus]|uniref:Uncharacterized protein n=1 Tax=Necator americanus TaxID=51031 RepID=A0ABR1E5Z4_NECAM